MTKHQIQHSTTTKFRIHASGTIAGEGKEVFNHTYDYDSKYPPTYEEARKIAGDFETIENLIAEEVLVTVNKRIVTLK